MPQVPEDFIWIEEAAEQYGRSRFWLKQQVDAGKLSFATIEGDKKLYLLRSELDKLMEPKIQRNPSATTEDAAG